MTTIIAGRFTEQSEAQGTVEELLRAGFAREHVSTFYCNPPGQHGTYAIGGDADKSQGAKESDRGVAKGAAAGAAVGLAAAPILGPIGAVTGGLVGAHIGGTMGAMSEMKERGDASDGDLDNAVGERRAGMMVAVGVSGQDLEDRAVNVLRSLGAADIERADGTIENGDWVDFDPLSHPVLVRHAPSGSAGQAPQRRL